jgi:preprotein translocase subunit SecG
MNLAIVILLLVVCVILGFFVLIQNPKGGGLAGNFGGLGQQMMGVQQSTDTVEKGTWILGALMGIICIAMVALSGGAKKSAKTESEEALKGFTGGISTPATGPATGPATATPATGTATPATGTTTPATGTTTPATGTAQNAQVQAAPAQGTQQGNTQQVATGSSADAAASTTAR